MAFSRLPDKEWLKTAEPRSLPGRMGLLMAARSFPEPLISLASGVLGDFRRLFIPLAWFELVFKGVVALLGFAGGAGLLAILMQSTGTSAVTNTDIVEFLLTPVGVLVVAMLGLSTLLGTVLEYLGVMAIAAQFQRRLKIDALGITQILGSLLLRLLRLEAAGLALLVLTAAPLALLGGLTYAALLSAQEIREEIRSKSSVLPEMMNRHRITREMMNRHRITRPLTFPRSGVGSASTPDQPALDGSVPCSFLDCGHAEAQGAVPAPGANTLRSAGRQYPASPPQLPPRKSRCEPRDAPGGSAAGDEA